MTDPVYVPMSGINGRFSIDLGAGLVEIKGSVDYQVDETRKRFDTSSMGESSETSVAGFSAGKITLTILKNGNQRTIETANDGQPHLLLLECDRSAVDPAPLHNWNGMGTIDISTKGGVADAIKQTVTITAASPGIVSAGVLPS